jgi:hypothetical protein
LKLIFFSYSSPSRHFSRTDQSNESIPAFLFSPRPVCSYQPTTSFDLVSARPPLLLRFAHPSTLLTMSDLASRITKPEDAATAAAPATETPIAETQVTEAAGIDDAQADGAGQVAGGSNLQEVNYDVEVSLNEIQRDLANPLGSVQTFADLGLYVPPPPTLLLPSTLVYS